MRMTPGRHQHRVGFVVAAMLVLTAAVVGKKQQPNARANSTYTLDSVLSSLDTASQRVKTVVADAQSSKYTKVVNDTTTESGQLFYRKTKKGPQLALDLTQSASREFLYRDNIGWMYQPAMHQVQKIDLAHNRTLVEQFFLLGLGGAGHTLTRSFDVRYEGLQPVDGTSVPKLLLTPRDPQFARNVTSIELWFDPTNWIAVQQRFNQPSGDYQQLHYTHVRLNAKIPDSRFATSFPGATIITQHP